jgi:hypothetical protein
MHFDTNSTMSVLGILTCALSGMLSFLAEFGKWIPKR